MLKIGNLVKLKDGCTTLTTESMFIVVKTNTYYPGYIEVLSPTSNKKRMINKDFLKKVG